MAAHGAQRLRLLLLGLALLAAGGLIPPAGSASAVDQAPARRAPARAPRLLGDEAGEATVYAGGHSAAIPGPDALVRLLVVLRTPPVAAHRSAGRTASAQALRVADEQAGVRAALLSKGLAHEVGAPLRYLVNALPVAARGADRAAIAALPEVAAVFPDYELRAADDGDDGAIERVGAPALWAKGARGQGVTVAVLDSGIDYTHPDLGGCLGPACKVRGGYDLVNDDADPRDDNGHGTHVAGIVAANGTSTGVAPEATLLAYKVLNDAGFGSVSRIIAGLERAADPDGDPATDDAPDVINMSLGGPGTPDDPLSQAVNRVVAQGVVVVVSAGNEGEAGYGSVGSPGAAVAAITVGATDAADAPTYFSSLGPVGVDAIKPDLVAPGAKIRSTVPTFVDASGYARLSGTSMASPHVAGLAALLRQRHPRWLPADIKASLMGGAQPLGQSPFVAGSGRASGDAADAATALAQPPSLSLGLVDDSGPTWTAEATLFISNTTTAERTYQIAAADLPPGASVQLGGALRLRRGEGRAVPVRLVVDVAALPVPAAAPYAYSGTIVIAGGGATQRVPLAFVRAAQLHLDWGEDPPEALYIHDRGARGVDALRTFSLADLTLPPGAYDLMAIYNYGHVVLRPGVALRGRTSVALRRGDATASLSTALLTADGQRAQTSPLGATWSLLENTSRRGLVFRSVGSPSVKPLLLSPAPGYTYESHQLASVAGARYDLAYRAGEIVADRELTLDARRFTPARYRYAAPPGAERVLPMHSAVSAGGALEFLLGLPQPVLAEDGFEETIWRAPQDGAGWLLPYRAASVYTTSLFQPEGLLYRTPPLDANDGASYGTLPVGFGPALWAARFANTADMTLIVPGAGGYALADQWGNAHASPLRYTLDGDAPAAGTLDDAARVACSAPQGCWAINASGSHQRLTIPYRSVAEGYDGWAEGALTAEFDLARDDRNPPAIASFALEADTPRALAAGDAATLRLKIADDVALAGVQVYADVGAGWQAQPVSAAGDAFSVRFEGLPPLAAVGLRIVAEDTSGNRITNELRPAFVGGLPDATLSAAPRVSEGAGAAVATVRLSRAVDQTVTVGYATRAAGATAGGDFAAISGQLVFAPGETSKELRVAIRDDTLREGDEAFALALEAPRRALLPEPAALLITIVDDDAPIEPAPSPTPNPTPQPAPAAFHVYLPLLRR